MEGPMGQITDMELWGWSSERDLEAVRPQRGREM